MESNDHLIGKQLGTCILDRNIGSGGMGMVYLAHQTRPVRDVAVKVLHSGVGIYTDAHKEFLARFRREANVIARLDHVNILPIYEYDEQDGLAYLTMPYLTGGSLLTLLKERGKFSPQEAFKYIEQAGSALQYAHEHQIVHRDVKPGNILFHADGRLMLVDFGIARITQKSTVGDLSDPSLTAVGQFLGSVEYMAPEMVQGHGVDYRADLYELGIVLFQMLTGSVPFKGETVLSIAAKHIHEMPPSLSSLDSSISLALDKVVQKALSKRPEDRYNSASEMVEAVRNVITAPLSFSPLSNSLLGGQFQPLQQPYNNSNSVFQTEYHPFETAYQVDLPSNNVYTPYGGTSNNSYTSAPGDVARVSSGGMSDSPLANMMKAEQENISPTSYFNTPQNPQTSVPPYTNHAQNPQTSVPPYTNHAQNPQTSVPPYTNHAQNPQTSVPPYTNHAQNRSRKSRTGLNWIFALCIVLVLCIVGVLFIPHLAEDLLSTFNSPLHPGESVAATATSNIQGTATPTASEAAEAVVQRYFSDINKADFPAAYQQWSVTVQREQPYSSFRAGYANTEHDDVTYDGTTLRSDGSYQVNVHITTTEIDANGTTTSKNFQGYYVVGLDAGELKMLPASQILPAS